MRARPLRATRAVAAGLVALVVAAPLAAAELAPDVVRALAASPYVYVATQRKDGNFGAPSEIWFMWDRGAVWMASPTTAWRVKRIRAGRPTARIAVGATSGPAFLAKGAFVRDPDAYERLYAAYAKKYPQGWPKYETKFREGLRDGSRVLMRYEPLPASTAAATTVSPRPTASP